MPPLGKYFLIRSKLNDLVLELEEGKSTAGTPVVTWSERGEKEGRDYQLWYRDDNTGTLRNKLNGYCIDLKDTNIVVANPFQDFRENQMWEIEGERIQNRKGKSTVLGIDDKNSEPGATLASGTDKKRPDQCWVIEYQPARFFIIKSKMHGKLLDVYNSDPTPGVPVIIHEDTQCKRDNQLWYEDQNAIIRSKLSEFALDASGENVCMQPYSAQNQRQQWIISGDVIRNKHDAGEVLDILREKKQNKAYVGAYKFHGKPNQRWNIVYLGEGCSDSTAVKMMKAPIAFTKKLFNK